MSAYEKEREEKCEELVMVFHTMNSLREDIGE